VVNGFQQQKILSAFPSMCLCTSFPLYLCTFALNPHSELTVQSRGKAKVFPHRSTGQVRWWRSILISGMSSRQSFAPPTHGRRGRESGIRCQRLGIRGWGIAIGDQRPETSIQHSALITQHSGLRTQHSALDKSTAKLCWNFLTHPAILI